MEINTKKIMKTLLFLVVLSCIFPTAAIPFGAATAEVPQIEITKRKLPTYVFQNVNVIPMSPLHRKILRRQTVIVKNGIIQTIKASKDIQASDIPEGAVLIPARRKYLMPGLIDSHVHLKYWYRIFPELENPVHTIEDSNTLHLANGITSVYNLAGYYPEILTWRKKINRGNMIGPTIYCASRPITDIVHLTPADVEAVVLDAKKRGFDGLKVSGPMKLQNYQKLIEVADRVGMDFFGHTPQEAEVPLSLILENQRMICHTTMLFLQIWGTWAPDVSSWLLQELAQQISTAGTVIQPTVAVSKKDVMYHYDDWFNQQLQLEWLKYMPDAALTIWLDQDYWRYDLEYAQSAWDKEIMLCKEMKKAGVFLSAGSDAPVRPFHTYGYGFIDELRYFVEDMGIPVYQTLLAATYNNATWMGILEETGTVEEGKRADLILLKKNPTKNLKNLQKILGVMVRGNWLGREDLDERLDKLEKKVQGN